MLLLLNLFMFTDLNIFFTSLSFLFVCYILNNHHCVTLANNCQHTFVIFIFHQVTIIVSNINAHNKRRRVLWQVVKIQVQIVW